MKNFYQVTIFSLATIFALTETRAGEIVNGANSYPDIEHNGGDIIYNVASPKEYHDIVDNTSKASTAQSGKDRKLQANGNNKREDLVAYTTDGKVFQGINNLEPIQDRSLKSKLSNGIRKALKK